MKHLFIARHGVYSPGEGGDRLNDFGRQQMETLGKSMKEILNGNSARIISSTAPRALDSSEVLITQLNLLEFEQIPYLWSGSDAPDDSYYFNPNEDKLIELVNERKDSFDGLIMVTHLEVAEDFPSYFLKKELGKEEHIGGILKGQAVHLDLEGRTYQILPKYL